mgnify:CR=1 FL=1
MRHELQTMQYVIYSQKLVDNRNHTPHKLDTDQCFTPTHNTLYTPAQATVIIVPMRTHTGQNNNSDIEQKTQGEPNANGAPGPFAAKHQHRLRMQPTASS